MNEDVFAKTKNDLYLLIKACLNDTAITDAEKSSIKQLRTILDQYHFDNRFQMKGFLSKVIVDSLQIDYSFGTQFIKFDERI